MNRMRKSFITAAATAGLLLASAAPAMASGGPVTVSGSVGQYLTLTGFTSAVSFGAITPGTPATVPGQNGLQVSTNDSKGFSESITPGAAFLDSPANVLPNNLLSIQQTDTGAANFTMTLTPNGMNVLTPSGSNVAGTTSISEQWTLNAPAATPVENFSEVFTYSFIGN